MSNLITSRPDLSFITSISGATTEQITGEVITPIREMLTVQQQKQLDNAIALVPELLCIAEAFYDSMVGTPAENSINFMLVKKVLNNISKTK